MKNIFLFFVCMQILFLANAQFTTSTSSTNERYIEVKVTDTLLVNPDAITLKIELPKKEKSGFFDDDSDQDIEQQRKEDNEKLATKKKIESVLEKYNLNYKFHEKKDDKDFFSKDLNLFENAYEVHLNDIALLKKIKSDLSALDKISIIVTNTQLKNKETYELLLIDKLMKKAEREATAIAKAMNVSLGQPLNVSNQSATDIYTSMFNNPESMGGFGAIFSMMGNLFKNNASPENVQVNISKTLVVRYAVK